MVGNTLVDEQKPKVKVETKTVFFVSNKILSICLICYSYCVIVWVRVVHK